MKNNKFKFLNKTIDLLSIYLKGKRIILQPISEQFTDEIFKEFTKEITRLMYPKSAEKKEETVNFLVKIIGE